MFTAAAVVVAALYIGVGMAAHAATDAAGARAQLSRLRVAAEALAVYDRRAHFGAWSQAGGGCLDVRGQVLAAESLAAIGRSAETPAGRCRVVRGRWRDPYTGTAIEDARQVDVDHVVPLKEAWESGASGWTRERRRAYANDLTHPDTLMAVSAAANRAKGDKDPAQWLPPAAAFRCRYLEMWVGIKARWDLAVDPAEARAIAAGLAACP